MYGCMVGCCLDACNDNLYEWKCGSINKNKSENIIMVSIMFPYLDIWCMVGCCKENVYEGMWGKYKQISKSHSQNLILVSIYSCLFI